MQQIDHRVIKLLVGIIAIAMPFVLDLSVGWTLRSISLSYHLNTRDLFVGLLFAVAALFLSFSGEDDRERILTVIASLLAATVALAPCECDLGKKPFSDLHFPAAGGLFAILGYFCWRFRDTARGKVINYPEASNRALVYSLCLAVMVACGILGALYACLHLAFPTHGETLDATFPYLVFWLEAPSLVAFGVSWLAASRTLPWITNEQERFSVRKGMAPEDQRVRQAE